MEDPLTPAQMPLIRPPILFAHRGARAHSPENTLPAFSTALEMGATGLESDVWITADGVAVLDHDGTLGRWGRRRIVDVARAELPPHIPTLEEFYALVGPEVPVSLDIKDPDAIGAVIDAASAAQALAALWAVHEDPDVLAGWRVRHPDLKLINSTHLGRMKSGPERAGSDLRAKGITGINLHGSEWTGGLTALFHRFGLITFGWDAQHEHQISRLLHIGIDGVFSDHVDRLVDAWETRSEATEA
jgi:glycerophosphoryl diester phosphodiesterase